MAAAATPHDDDRAGANTANIVLIGAGWWSQGWHLPHLHRNEKVIISAIVDSSPHPTSNLNPHLESLDSLAQRYHCPVFHSLSEVFNHPSIGPNIDGAIVCTPHSTHFDIGKQLIAEGQRRYEEARIVSAAAAASSSSSGDTFMTGVANYRRINVLMEKPMTTNVHEAKELHDLLMACRKKEEEANKSCPLPDAIIGGGIGCFLVNHSANYRPQARSARELVQSSNDDNNNNSNNKIGHIRHISAFFASPLSWIFDDPSNKGWNEPDESGSMLGNGFAWGQSSHILAWIYHVVGPDRLVPTRVFCTMTHSDRTGADVSHSATIICNNGATSFSLSGTSLLPGNAHSDPPVAKRIMIKIFGTKGALIYSGNDRDFSSGTLEYLRGCEKDGENDDDDDERSTAKHIGAVEIHCPELGFQFEELDQDGTGPESLQCFIDACLGRNDFYVGADSLVGLRSVQTIDAMYRSHASGLHAFEFNQQHLEKEHSNCTSRCAAIGTNMGALEERLGTIIDKSSKNLLNISTEYYSQKQRWENLRKPPPRVSRSLIPSSSDNERFIFDHIVNEIENSSPCGPYQQAAVLAFHATRNGSRYHATGGRAADDIRAAESRIKQDVDRLVNDKFKCTSIAIDALRDQLVILADELRELNRNATLQERRVNVLCHDVDSCRGIINTMEAHMLDENGRIKTIGLEMERLKEVVATKASFVDVKTELKSNRLKSKTSLSDMKAQLKREGSSVMNEVNDLKKWMQQQYSEGLDKQMNQISSSTQAFQRNLVETMKRMVYEEVASTEQKCLAVIEKEMQKISAENNSGKSKEYVKIISQIVTKAATKIESNLREDLEKKLEKMIDVKQTAVRQQDTATIDNRIKETVVTDLNSMKESITQLSIKQELFISKDMAELLTESCRAQLSQSMSRLEEKCATVASNASSMATSMSEAIMQKWKIDHENILNRLQYFITKDEANDIAGVTSKVHFDKCLSLFKEMEMKSQQHSRDLISKGLRDETAAVSKRVFDEQFEQRNKAVAHSVETQIDASKAQLMNTFSAQLRNYTTKEEASGIVKSKIESDRCFQITADRCHSTAGKLVDMEAKLEEIESDFDSDVYKLLNFVKSIDDRVSTLENIKNEQISPTEGNTINGALLSDINREKVSMGSIVDQSNIPKFKGDIKVMQTPHRSKVDTLSTSTKDCIPVQAVNTGSPVSVNDGNSGSISESDSLSQRSYASASSSHAASENGNREVGEQKTLIQERNRMLSNVARTLSAVAVRRDDSSLRQLAAELRAGKLDMNTSKTHDQEVHGPNDPNNGRILGMVTAQQSDGESIDTDRAMSLCCVQLDESYDGMGSDGTGSDDNIHRSESPVSFVGTIDTAEAISLCRVKFPSNRHDGLELKDEFIPPSIEKNSHTSIEISIINCTSSSHSSSDESGSHSLKLLDHSSKLEEFQFGPSPKKSTNNVLSQTSFAGPPSSITSDQSEHAVELFDVHYVDSVSSRKQNNSVVEKEEMTILASENSALEHQPSSELLDASAAHTADPLGGRPCDYSLIVRYEEDVPQETREAHVSSCNPTELQTLVNESVKDPSLPSIDIVLPPFLQSHNTCSYIMEDEESLPGSLTPADEIFDCNPSSHKYNPTRIFIQEPYRGWDALLNELRASGRILPDGNSSDESSHGSISFVSENAE